MPVDFVIFGERIKVRKKIRDRWNKEPHLTHAIVGKKDKNTRKHHTRVNQEVSSIPQW